MLIIILNDMVKSVQISTAFLLADINSLGFCNTPCKSCSLLPLLFCYITLSNCFAVLFMKTFLQALDTSCVMTRS